MKYSFLLVVFLISVITAYAQKEIKSNMLMDKIKIDGKLDESFWQNHLVDGKFIQTSPNNGSPSSQLTKIAVANDESYFYIAAEIHINEGQKINKKLSERDDNGTTDYFGVILDPFGASREGWAFLVTAANVQLDIKVTEDENYGEWNAVWESAVHLYENYWSVELKIPFNSLRFPEGDFDNFTINFERFDSSTSENSFWNHIDENLDGTLNQFGKLTELTNVNPPINLSFNPYISYVYEETALGNSKSSFNGGLDLKYVYKNAYTLDVSLIPDFSQAPSDEEILNLSPFDIQYNENRQFFVEGTELFDKGNYLYTRRIGGKPINSGNIAISDNEEITENPVATNILNLVKFTGKSNSGLSIGILNGITRPSEATVLNTETNNSRKVVTNPLTNYNAIVIDHTLKNNSSITFINNSVVRSGQAYDANLSAILLKLYNKNRKYSLDINSAISQKHHINTDSDVNRKSLFGNQYKIKIQKVGGKFKGGLYFSLLDSKYDNNDFGFHNRNNILHFGNYLLYAQTNPKKRFSYYHLLGQFTEIKYFSLMKTEKVRYNVEFYGQLKNNHRIYLETKFENHRHNYYEARVKDQVYNQPDKLILFFEYQTNRNKNLFFATYLDKTFFLKNPYQTNSTTFGYGIDYRLGEHLMMEWDQDWYFNPNSLGHLMKMEDHIVFGQRNLHQLTNGFSVDYAVNSKVHFNVNVRHYWIQVNYKNQYSLLSNGDLTTNHLEIDLEEENVNFNTFNLNFLAKWQFAPGSEMSVSYKLGANHYDQNVKSDYHENFNTTINESSNHTVALKFTYLLDFNKIKI